MSYLLSVPRALRELAALVLCCLLLLALMLPAQRTAERLHVHLAPLLALEWSAPAPTLFTERGNRAPVAGHGHAAVHAHGHAYAAAHVHSGEEGNDAMVLAAHDADSSASAAAARKRHLFEQDAAWAITVATPTAPPARAVAADAPLRPPSRVEPPLERPPRALG